MTNNQIAYMNYQENSRHNLATEDLNFRSYAETVRSNISREGETRRSNIANEVENKRSNLARETETNRHNLASENFNLSQLSETKRHNVEGERIAALTQSETVRHNQATEMIQRAANEAERLYKEAQVLLRTQELDLAERKEVQRIAESLRDFEESVRYHDLQTLTSKGLASMVQTLVDGLGGLGLGAGAFSLGSFASNPLALPGPVQTGLQKFVSGIKTLGKNIILVPDTLLDLAKEKMITPPSNRGEKETVYQ